MKLKIKKVLKKIAKIKQRIKNSEKLKKVK